MATQLWMQDSFSKGELSPYMYARASLNQYFDGLKRAQNVLNYPSGAAGKRFGTLYQATLTNINNLHQIFFETFQYLDECIYQLVFTPLNIAIYLEGILVANVVTVLNAEQVFNLNSTVLANLFRVTGQGLKPYDLARAPNADNVITSVGSSLFTITNALTVGQVLPVQVKTTGTLPTTVPQINAGVTYFVKVITANTVALYPSSIDAKYGTEQFSISNNGTGTNTLVVFNTWSFTNPVFKNLPVYDFNGSVVSYDSLTFTPSATTGAAVTVTVSGAGYAPLTSAYVGGAFIGAGGTSRITAVASATSFTVAVQTPFDSTSAIQGSLVFLAEPAWSNLRGWPQKCSSYQNRALFGNTASLPNGFFASVVNDYTDFGDLTSDDDDAISWYPSSNDVNVIRFIVPFRSITVHTNTGIYSSPLSEISAITPSTFTLQLQDSTPANVIQPQAIDNQIIVLSGNDVHTMLWDGINNAYTANIVSISSEQVIRDPVDECVFADLTRAGSRYVFIINSSGSMAVYQTLLAEQVSGFTPQILEQSYGNGYFLQAGSASNGRCWFVCQREIATEQISFAIIGFTADSLEINNIGFPQTPTAITFITSGTLPASTPQVTLDQYYWAVGIDDDFFYVYLTQEDAIAGVNHVKFTSSGTTSRLIPWTSVPIFTLEELTQDVRLDCAVYYNGTPTDTVATGKLFNAQKVKMWGDGFGFDAEGFDDEVVFQSHGETVQVREAYVGFPIKTIMEPMPIAAPPGAGTTLTKPKHIRSVRFMFNNTIGGTINGVPIALEPFDASGIGQPPFPARGIFEMSIMRGWDDFNLPTFTIEHDEPFNIELIGVSYSVDI